MVKSRKSIKCRDNLLKNLIRDRFMILWTEIKFLSGSEKPPKPFKKIFSDPGGILRLVYDESPYKPIEKSLPNLVKCRWLGPNSNFYRSSQTPIIVEAVFFFPVIYPEISGYSDRVSDFFRVKSGDLPGNFQKMWGNEFKSSKILCKMALWLLK